MLKKGFVIISVLLIFIISIGMISASDANSPDTIGIEESNDIETVDQSYDCTLSDTPVDLSDESEENLKVDLDNGDESSLEETQENTLKDSPQTSEKTLADIQQSVNAAKANDVIELNGTYIASSNKSLEINKSLSFEGNGVTILDGKSKALIEGNEEANIIFRNIVFKNLNYETDVDLDVKYGINLFGKTVSIINCSFINCGIELWGENLTIKDSNFKKSNLIFWSEAEGRVSNCDFIKSNIFANTLSWITIKNCDFINKSTIEAGKVKLVDCNFKQNNNKNKTTILKDFYGTVIITNNNKTKKYSRGANIAIRDSFKSSKLWYVKAIKRVTVYKSSAKLIFRISRGYFNKKAVSKYPLRIEISKGKKTWYYFGVYDFIETSKYGYIRLKTSNLKMKYDMFDGPTIYNTKKGKKNLAPGTYKIYISNIGSSDALDSDYSYLFFTYKGTVKIKKMPTIVKAPKISAKYKKTKYFKVTLKKKSNKKALKKIKLKLKVYTGKKYKIYTVKTNKKGVAKFNTKKLKRGIHKVEILSNNKIYEVNKKSRIKIK